MASPLRLINAGWLELSSRLSIRPSPNFNERPLGSKVSLLVIHNISLPPGQFGTPYVADLFLNRINLSADPWFKNLEGLKVSAHFLIDRQGHITQFVSCDKRAWHAGVSNFNGQEDCNDFSIGVELEGTDLLPYTMAQYAALSDLSTCLRAHYPLDAVRGHCEIAPGRKTDPGQSFDWQHYAALAAWPETALGSG